MKKVLFVFAAVAAAVALSPTAFAGSLNLKTAINFTCSGQSVAGPGKASTPIGSGCTPTGGYEGLSGSAASNWQQSGGSSWYQQSTSGTSYYTLSSNATKDVNGTTTGNGQFTSKTSVFNYESDGGFNWTNSTGNTATATATNKIPAIETNHDGGVHQAEIQDSTGTFLFDGWYFGETKSTTLSYMIFGYNGNTLVYCVDSNGNSCSGNLKTDWDTVSPTWTSGVDYTLISNPYWATKVTSVYIDTQIPSGAGSFEYDDNYLVTQTPEPDSLVLLGTGFGLMGLALFLRKRSVGSAVNQPNIA